MSRGQPIPRLTTHPARCGVGSHVQVLLSGVAASLLRRSGLVNAPPKNTGPNSLNLDCVPVPNDGLRYGGLMSEIPASSTASAIPRRGNPSSCSLIFQTTDCPKSDYNGFGTYVFGAPILPNKQRMSNGVSGGWFAGVHARFPFLQFARAAWKDTLEVT